MPPQRVKKRKEKKREKKREEKPDLPCWSERPSVEESVKQVREQIGERDQSDELVRFRPGKGCHMCLQTYWWT